MRGVRLWILTWMAVSAVRFGNLAHAQSDRPGRPPERWAILISGISGAEEIQKEYLQWIQDLRASLENSLRFSKDHVFVLFDDPSKDPDSIQYQSTRDNLEKVCRDIAASATNDDMVFVFMAGHGNSDGRVYKFNLPGPDPTGEDLASILYSIPAERFVVVNTTTCSGGSIPALAQVGKIVVSATKSGREKNLTHMGQFFVEAFSENNGDTDKNGRISILEAFTYARRKVEEYYSKDNHLQTEHPVLDDDGDGEAQSNPGPENGEGLLARTTYLDAGSPLETREHLSAEERTLLEEAQALERKVDALRYSKGAMPEAEYEKKLEELLLKLARINAKLRKNQ